MIVRGLDATGDWLFGKGKNDYKKDVNAVSQNIKTRLQSFLGDCFFARESGIPWFDYLGSKRLLELRLAVSATILNTQDVTGIVELSAELSNNRQVTIQYTVNTIYGRITDESIQEV